MEYTITNESNAILYYISRDKEYICLGLEMPIDGHLLLQEEEIPETLLCIAYPKGKRPELPYPQNPSKLESNGLRKSK
jgi:hypothetical protein